MATRTVPRRRPRRWNLDPSGRRSRARHRWRGAPARCRNPLAATRRRCRAWRGRGPRRRRRPVRRQRPSPPRRPASSRRRRRRASARPGGRPRAPCAATARLGPAPHPSASPVAQERLVRCPTGRPDPLATGRRPSGPRASRAGRADRPSCSGRRGGRRPRAASGARSSPWPSVGHHARVVPRSAGVHGPDSATEPGVRAPSLIRGVGADQLAGGRSTLSITWMTPLEAMMSVVTTWVVSLR